MKKVTCIFLILFYFCSSNAYPSFFARLLPNFSIYWYDLEYQKFVTEINVQGLFYETTVEMQIKLGKDWICTAPEAGNYEYYWQFRLPDESFIEECQLWSNSKQEFVSAQIVDLTTGVMLYDPNSSSSPKLLLRSFQGLNYQGKTDRFFNLRIAPVAHNEVVKIKIKYLSLCQMYWDIRRILINSRDFYTPQRFDCNNHALAEFMVLDMDNPDLAPRGINDFNLNWSYKDNHWYAQASWKDFSLSSIMRAEKESKSETYLQVFREGNHQFYQLATLPKIQDEERPSRHLIIGIDLIDEVYPYTRKALVQILEWPIRIATTEKDSVVFMNSSSLGVEWLDKKFVAAKPENIVSRLNQCNQITPKLNTLPFMLRDAVKFLNNSNVPGEIWIFSNATQHGYPPATAMDIVNQSLNKAINPIKFRILDAKLNYRPYYSINNKAYYGNEYLYEILSRLSKGSMEVLYGKPGYDFANAILDCLAPTVSSVEIDPKPENGLAFSRFPLNRGRSNFNITSRYYEIGLFSGDVPFELSYYGIYLDDLYSKKFMLTPETPSLPDSVNKNIKTFWYAQYINQLLMQPQNYTVIKYIEQLSVENKVLSPYVAFVLPGPNGEKGFLPLAAEDSLLIKEIEINESFPADFALSGYPNPFNSAITIMIDLPEAAALEPTTIYILNTHGQRVKSFQLNQANSAPRVTISWDGRDDQNKSVASGIYFVFLKTKLATKSLKITLIR